VLRTRFRKDAAFLFSLAALCFAWPAAASTIPLWAEAPRMDPYGFGPGLSLASRDAEWSEDDTALAGLAAFRALPRQANPEARTLTPSPQPATVKNPFFSVAP
jgi:hypothetical protein